MSTSSGYKMYVLKTWLWTLSPAWTISGTYVTVPLGSLYTGDTNGSNHLPGFLLINKKPLSGTVMHVPAVVRAAWDEDMTYGLLWMSV